MKYFRNPRSRGPSGRLAGFTLIELLIVIAVIAVLAAILLPTYAGAQKRPYDLAALACGQAILTNAVTYKAEHGGAYPTLPFSPDVLGRDVAEACAGQRVMPYASPSSKTGSEYTITSLDSKGRPAFFVANNSGSGVYVAHSDDTFCGASGCKLKFLKWNVYGL